MCIGRMKMKTGKLKLAFTVKQLEMLDSLDQETLHGVKLDRLKFNSD